MSKVQIDAAPRTDFGKGAARKIRREGRVPAVVYGGEAAVQHVSLPGHDLMMALKTAQVILEVNVDGDALNTAPRQIQRDPVRGTLEHVDLIVLSAQEVRERLVVGAAVAKAEKVATEEELDTVTLVMAVRELLDEGLETRWRPKLLPLPRPLPRRRRPKLPRPLKVGARKVKPAQTPPVAAIPVSRATRVRSLVHLARCRTG